MPKLAIAAVLLALVALASTFSYAGYLLVGIVSGYLGTGRVAAGLVLGILFARLPWVRQRKLRTVGLLPKPARLPVMIALLALGMLTFLHRGDIVSMLFLGFTAAFLLTYPRLRRLLVNRALSSLFKSSSGPTGSRNPDPTIIDAEFREKKD